MKPFALAVLCAVALLLTSSPCSADSFVSLEGLQALGVVPLSRVEAEDFFSRERQRGQTESVRHTLRMDKGGTLRGEYCSKRYLACDKPGKGQGEWSIDADGTLRLQVSWVSHSETRLAGKLYRHEGFLYLFDANDPAKPWTYRFEQ